MVMNMLFLEILVCSLLIGSSYAIEPEFAVCPQLFYQGIPPNIIYHSVLNTDMCGSVYRCLCENYRGTYYLAAYYDSDYKVPIFSAYRVDMFQRIDKNKNKKPRRSWRKSKNLRFWEQPSPRDYIGVGVADLNRGHLAPRFYFPTYEGWKATDVLTNIALQYRLVNQYKWHTLEKSTFDASRDHCQYDGSKSYFITGTVPSHFEFFKKTKIIKKKKSLIRLTTKINIPDFFWTAVCCDTSGAQYKNKYKGWSFAYIVENLKSGQGIFDIMRVEAFLKLPVFRFKYKHFSLFKDIYVPVFQQYGHIVKNCLFDSNKADELIKSIRKDYEMTPGKVPKQKPTIHFQSGIQNPTIHIQSGMQNPTGSGGQNLIGSYTDYRTFIRPTAWWKHYIHHKGR